MIRGSGGSFVVRMANMALKFVTSFALARLLGADLFGVYNFAMAWVLLLVVPALFGLDRLLIRNLSVMLAREQWGQIRGVLHFGRTATLITALIFALVVALFAWITYDLTGKPALLKAKHTDFADTALITLFIALILLPLRAMLLTQQSAMQGLRHVVFGQLPEQIILPAVFLVLIGGGVLLGVLDTPELAMSLHIVAAIIALACSGMQMRCVIPLRVRRAEPEFVTRDWVGSAFPMALTRGLVTFNVQADALLLGGLASAEAVALFTTASQGAGLLTLVLVSVNAALGPMMAQLHAEKDHEQLQRVVTQSALLVLLLSLPLALIFLIGGRFYLGLFGSAFKEATAALTILVVGQVFNAGTGSVGLLLMMTHHERAALAGIVAGVVIHTTLNVLLIPVYGIEGAAAAASAGLIVTNLVQMVLVWRLVGIHTTALGALDMLWKRQR